MCSTCGCSRGETRIQGLPHLAFGEFRIVQVERDILSKNNSYAEKNRAEFQQRGIFALNIVSSPGSGKTALLVRTISDLRGALPIAVIEGDQETANDAERIRTTGAPAVQINTGRGCHLDAQAVERAVAELNPANGGLLFIENVGNLVCPSAFDLGEAARVVVFSVTEGEDKPVKYPDMFASADLILINKIDLLPYLQYDMAKALDYIRKVNRTADVIQVSAAAGQGLDRWYAWLRLHLVRGESGKMDRCAEIEG